MQEGLALARGRNLLTLPLLHVQLLLLTLPLLHVQLLLLPLLQLPQCTSLLQLLPLPLHRWDRAQRRVVRIPTLSTTATTSSATMTLRRRCQVTASPSREPTTDTSEACSQGLTAFFFSFFCLTWP